jgi:hypothetical protein
MELVKDSGNVSPILWTPSPSFKNPVLLTGVPVMREAVLVTAENEGISFGVGD